MNSLIKFKEFVNEITAQNGRLYKESVLEKYKDDDSIKYFLQQVYDPYRIFGISDKKLNKKVYFEKPTDFTMCGTFPTAKDILCYLAYNNTGRDIDIFIVQKFKELILKNDSELITLFDKIITKNLQLGVDTKTINKIIPKLISEFNVMLANKYFDKPEVVEGKEFAITTKIDGCRIIAIKENGEVSFWTRQGQKYEGLVDLEAELLNNFPDNICLDGELTLLNPYYEEAEPVTVVRGEDVLTLTKPGFKKMDSGEQYKATTKLCRKDGEKHGLKMLVFDSMSSEDFKNQSNDTPYSLRRQILDDIFNSNWHIQEIDFQTGEEKISEEPKEFKFFELLPILYQGNDISKITEWLNYNISKGEEGVMINICNAPYQFKRTNSLLKVKKMQTLDLEIVDYFEGDNSFTGMLGGFIVRYKDNNLVRVGSGFSKELRQEIWENLCNNPHAYDGKIIEVQYFEETQNANGGLSIRFPVFRCFRFDKSEPDF